MLCFPPAQGCIRDLQGLGFEARGDMRGPAALRSQGAGLLLVTGCGGLLRGSAEWSPSLAWRHEKTWVPNSPVPWALQLPPPLLQQALGRPFLGMASPSATPPTLAHTQTTDSPPPTCGSRSPKTCSAGAGSTALVPLSTGLPNPGPLGTPVRLGPSGLLLAPPCDEAQTPDQEGLL